MKVYIFTGPSLAPAVARRHWAGPVYLPPAAQGDVYRIARRKPWGIGIVDGLLERVPAVWHKEILWALCQGIHVYGSASMGALRAAELATFGMVGIGTIFEGYAKAVIEDDDEVMRIHRGAAKNYEPSSEAMVNIRRTLEEAVREGIIRKTTQEKLAQIGKAVFYPQRNYGRIIEEGFRHKLPAKELQRFREWVPAHQVDQQRLDATAMLRRMRLDLRAHPQGKQVNFSLEHTKYWDRVQHGRGERGR